ncbi:MAG TPA: DUF1566 domain-containing protein [Candidatus Udaeobacter sp.]
MENQVVRVLRVVVASPGDVEAERNALPEVIDEINRGVAADRNLRLELSRWETNTYPSFNSDGPQGGIDPILNIEQCDLVIGLFWHRFGTPTVDSDSGTEHEFRLAYEAWKRSGRPQIMMYFNEKATSAKSKEETDQWGRVLEFKHNFPKEGLWWPYKRTAEFVSLVRNHLTQYVRQFEQANMQRKPDGTTATAESSIPHQPMEVPEGVYLDRERRLMWTKEDNGKNLEWNEAKDYALGLSLGGYKDWRLPTIEELEDLYAPGREEEQKIRSPFRLTSLAIWSSTKQAPGSGWFFNFENGVRLYNIYGSQRCTALCVRGPVT